MIDPDRRRTWRVLLRTVLHWDFVASLLGAGLTLAFLLDADKPVTVRDEVLAAAVPYGIANATAALVMGRWLSDRLKDTSYGRVVRRSDPDEMATQMPYLVVALGGVPTSVVAILLLMTSGRRDGGYIPTAISYSAFLFFALYSFLSVISLVFLTFRHQRNAAELQALEEEVEYLRHKGRDDLDGP